MGFYRRLRAFLLRRETTEYFCRLREKTQSARGFMRLFYGWRYQKLMRERGCSIPLTASFADVPAFPHGLYGIFISQGARLGRNVTIFQQVTIGSSTLQGSKRQGAPVIGDNVYIGAGAKIIGNVSVGSNVRVGANAVVVTDIPDDSTVVLPPARIIRREGGRDNTFQRFADPQPNSPVDK